jgi:hypothetical protein
MNTTPDIKINLIIKIAFKICFFYCMSWLFPFLNCSFKDKLCKQINLLDNIKNCNTESKSSICELTICNTSDKVDPKSNTICDNTLLESQNEYSNKLDKELKKCIKNKLISKYGKNIDVEFTYENNENDEDNECSKNDEYEDCDQDEDKYSCNNLDEVEDKCKDKSEYKLVKICEDTKKSKSYSLKIKELGNCIPNIDNYNISDIYVNIKKKKVMIKKSDKEWVIFPLQKKSIIQYK